ncbi:MAG: class I SAM-dependent methyltransferase [Chloroflexia bacterium]|nr:class I SAM-dependent methyltransferase [Chloroflexia bacterium]
MRWKAWRLDLHYLLDRTPWDTGITPPEVVEWVESAPPDPGQALDLGCGTGTNSLYLARHGWQVVGVDISRLAICRARRKAKRAGAGRKVRFYRADVSRLDFLPGPFDLALDIGCLHSIPPGRRDAYAAGLARLVRPGGHYLLYAFTPRSSGLGVSPRGVRRLFGPSFGVERQEGGTDPTGPSSAWYWLVRE